MNKVLIKNQEEGANFKKQQAETCNKGPKGCGVARGSRGVLGWVWGFLLLQGWVLCLWGRGCGVVISRVVRGVNSVGRRG